MVEDIVSTGLSIRECVDALRRIGANVVAAACLIDRSGGEADVGVPLVSLIQYKVPAYPADQLPPELAAIPAVKPGSRGIQGSNELVPSDHLSPEGRGRRAAAGEGFGVGADCEGFTPHPSPLP